MRYLLIILSFWICGALYSQVPTGLPQLFNGKFYEFRSYVLIDSLIMMPCGDTLKIPIKPSMVFNCADSTFYFWNTQRWNKLAKASEIYWQLDADNNLTNKTFAGDNIIPFKNMKLVQPGFTGSQFSTWPTGNNTAFNHNILGIYGDEPSLDILIDSSSQFNIGGITFRGMDGIIPKLNAARFGVGAAAKFEYNAFVNGDTTATVELYLGDKNATTIHTFAWSLPGNHFFGFRRQYTAESKEALMFGTAIKGVNSTAISGLTDTSYFAGDAGNKNMYIFNIPTVPVTDTTNYRPWVTHGTTGATTRSYWSGLGLYSLGGLSGFAQTLASGSAGTDFAISSSGSTHTFNLPTASATNRGALSSADWTRFDSKLSNITGLVQQGSNVTITGTGTGGDPYIVNSSGGGSATPGGSDTWVQFNDGGVFGGDAGFTYNKTTNAVYADSVRALHMQSPILVGGVETSGTMTLRSTSGVGATDAIIFQVGNNGAVEGGRINSGGQLVLGSGTSSLPALALSQTNTGLYRPTTNQIALSAAGNTFVFSSQQIQFGSWANGITNNILGTNAGAGTTNRAANGMRIAAGQGTGSGASSYIALEVGSTGASGTTLNALVEMLRVAAGGTTINGTLTLSGVQEFADNAAAITGGLTVGQVYRTGDALKIVH